MRVTCMVMSHTYVCHIHGRVAYICVSHTYVCHIHGIHIHIPHTRTHMHVGGMREGWGRTREKEIDTERRHIDLIYSEKKVFGGNMHVGEKTCRRISFPCSLSLARARALFLSLSRYS